MMENYYDDYNTTFTDDHQDYGYYADADIYPQSSGSSSVHRFLAPAGEAPTVDYAVISVVVITLGLVLAIEVLRHQLDVAASGNPFFQTVLELMYRELTTLGIVEFCIYLMHKYYENFNFQMEAIFVDVHFMLFYTAVFNAIQSCLVRLLAGRRTDKAWIQTEDIDIGHYVAIRKELDRLESKLQRGDSLAAGVNNGSSHLSDLGDSIHENQRVTCWNSFKGALSNLAFKIRHPHLSRRKEQLLAPIRFHELRAHFIDSNNLPPKFKVSHYLKRSLTSVLLDFVHISPAAWIMLMASGNLLYFLSGMILSVTKDSVEVEEFLMYIFFAMMILFVAIAFVVFFKMKIIYYEITRMKLTIYDQNQSRQKTWNRAVSDRSSKYVDQGSLFWFSNPHFIIVVTQYMQFGYALCLAMIFTYYRDFKAKYELVNPNYLLLALLISYLMFLQIVSVIIPWYTLCTSMGQLVNKERLHETLAKLKLSEEIRYKETLEEEKKAGEEIARRRRETAMKRAEAAAKAEKEANTTIEKKGSAGMLNPFRTRSSGALDVGPIRTSDSSTNAQRKGSAERILNVFRNKSGDALDEGQDRHTRKKSMSDGVQFMSNIGDLHHLLPSRPGSPTNSNRLSAAAAQQLGLTEGNEHQIDETMFKTVDIADSSTTHERRRRKKSMSDNVVFMRAMNNTDPFHLNKIPTQTKQQPTLQMNDVENLGGTNKSAVMADVSKVSNKVLTRPRSNSIEMIRSVNETKNIVHEQGHPGPSEILGVQSDSREQRKQRRRLMKTQSEGVAIMCSSLEAPILSLDSVKERKSPQKLATLSELVQMSAKDLPEIPDFRPKVQPRRRSRARAASDGVSLMRAGLFERVKSTDGASIANVGEDETAGFEKMESICEANTAHGVHGTTPNAMIGNGGLQRSKSCKQRRMKTQSEGVAFMRASQPDGPQEKEPKTLATLSELTQMSAKDLPKIPEFQPVKQSRRPRVRSTSAGVALMRTGWAENAASAGTINKSTKAVPSAGEDSHVKNETALPISRVTFSPSTNERTPSLDITELEEMEEIDSTASEDGESDIDDVPDALPSDEVSGGLNRLSMMSRMNVLVGHFDLVTFFQGTRYRVISLLFGPMACFFFVAMRVEIFNIFSGVFVDQTGLWYKLLTPSFWVEFSLYVVMITEMISVLIIFIKKRGTEETRTLLSCTAAIIGLLINVMCLTLLIIAELKRCCPDNDEEPYNSYYKETLVRLLAPSQSKSSYYDDPTAEPAECCPSFGTRRYGGLGNTEPFTCLIALSPLRFFVAECIFKLLGRNSSDSNGFQMVKDGHSQHHHGPDSTIKMRDMWMTAIGVHSDIAKTAGLFSSELLQCMLGIYHGDKASEMSINDPGSSDANDQSTDHHERENSMDITSDASDRGPLSSLKSDTSDGGPLSPLKSSDLVKYESNDFGISFDNFAYPKARLIRKVRRVESRLLPLLDEWMVVDVVLTSHELILFDATDIPESVLHAHHGGKGLWLSEVAQGRNIISQFNLDDIDFIDIEHRAASPGNADGIDVEASPMDLREYWQGGSCNDYEVNAMNTRWGYVDEDRLKVHFKYNTLLLRFHVDLKEMESKPQAEMDDSVLMNHIGSQTKVWCRTIAHLRGSANLKQNLPHFDGAGEMEDFIEICDRAQKNNQHRRGMHNQRGTKRIRANLHRRTSSLGI